MKVGIIGAGAIVERTYVENDQTLFQGNIKKENDMQDFMQKVERPEAAPIGTCIKSCIFHHVRK